MRAALIFAALCVTAPVELPAQLEHLQTLQAHRAGVRCLAWSPDGTLATGGQDRLIVLWDSRGKLLQRLELQPGGG